MACHSSYLGQHGYILLLAGNQICTSGSTSINICISGFQQGGISKQMREGGEGLVDLPQTLANDAGFSSPNLPLSTKATSKLDCETSTFGLMWVHIPHYLH